MAKEIISLRVSPSEKRILEQDAKKLSIFSGENISISDVIRERIFKTTNVTTWEKETWELQKNISKEIVDFLNERSPLRKFLQPSGEKIRYGCQKAFFLEKLTEIGYMTGEEITMPMVEIASHTEFNEALSKKDNVELAISQAQNTLLHMESNILDALIKAAEQSMNVLQYNSLQELLKAFQYANNASTALVSVKKTQRLIHLIDEEKLNLQVVTLNSLKDNEIFLATPVSLGPMADKGVTVLPCTDKGLLIFEEIGAAIFYPEQCFKLVMHNNVSVF